MKGKIMIYVIAIMLTVVISITAFLLDGFVIKYLWEWFIVPLGVKPVTLIHAVGVSLLAATLTYQFYPVKRDELWDRLLFVYSTPIVALIFGWLIKFFI